MKVATIPIHDSWPFMLNSNLHFSGPMLVLLGVYLFEFNETTLPLVEKDTKPNDSKHVLTATSLFWTFHVQHVRQLECMTGFLKERGLKEEKLGGFSRKPRLLQFPSSPIHSSMVNSYCKHGVHPYYLLQKEPSQLHQIDNMTEQCSLFHTCTFKHCWLVDNLYWLVIIVVSFGTEISCVMLVTVLIFTSKKIIPPDCPLNPIPSSNEVFMFGPFEVRE